VQELAGVYREVERWIGEAKVDAVIALGALDVVGGDAIDARERREGERHGAEESGGDEDDEAEEGTRRERWALERLAHELCERGALVPMAKKKRLQQAADKGDDGSLPELPATLVALWTPLFVQVRTRHPLLPSVLVQTIVGRLLAVPGTSPQATDNKEDVTTKIGGSYDTCLAAWATWVIRTWEPTSTPKLGSRSNSSNATAGRTVKELFAGLGAAMVDDELVNPAYVVLCI
jgi:ribosomal biogenesis protein LAS1